ncbi:MAG: CerR family C-terminal domain-containing protein [Pseudomonadales bacterium]|nr:CerR family C-terminal domain-containing protein [Pseudomonadales bacterium]MCP5183085.1 CerR family C-terminal domain-containing protein [Pseudomonadales bacterium]
MITATDTRTALVQSAIRLIGLNGYEGVTTRQLAQDAGANVAAISYHFGGKDGLCKAAIDHVVSLVQPRLDFVGAVVAQARELAGNDPVRQARLLAQIVETMLETLLRTPELRSVLPFVVREMFAPGPYFDRFYRAVPQRVHELLTDVVAWILDLDTGSDAAKIRAHAVLGQLLVFQFGRPVLLRRLRARDYTAAQFATIRAQVTESVLRSLGLPHAP